MIIRSAYLEGSVDAADRAEFDRRMREVVLPAILTYPRIRDVKIRRLALPEPGAPPVDTVFDLHFDSIEDMEFALASATRQEVRAKIAEAMPLFKGRVYHLVFSQDA